MRTRPDLLLAKILPASRWAMALLGLGLIVALAIVLAEFCREVVQAVAGFSGMTGSEVTIAVLKLIDLVLIASLALMIIGAGVSVFITPAGASDQTRLQTSMADFGQLKVRGFGYISAIAAIDLLETFLNIEAVKKEDVLWQIAILAVFVVSGLLLAVTDRLAERE